MSEQQQQRREGQSRLHYDKANRTIRTHTPRWFCKLRLHWLVDHGVFENPRHVWRCKSCGQAERTPQAVVVEEK